MDAHNPHFICSITKTKTRANSGLSVEILRLRTINKMDYLLPLPYLQHGLLATPESGSRQWSHIYRLFVCLSRILICIYIQIKIIFINIYTNKNSYTQRTSPPSYFPVNGARSGKGVLSVRSYVFTSARHYTIRATRSNQTSSTKQQYNHLFARSPPHTPIVFTSSLVLLFFFPTFHPNYLPPNRTPSSQKIRSF